ncbi:cytochrome b/b6 domain-containing protein [Chitinimonas taiwanensis]|uniref:Cytochrome b n=1 Tax=Chitinimonas taiwanensis DSM 18899 TaxID=1121279 RepID=A0A1K2HM00_9NEIS|nr:cytochrome b/b6 domain-containing protein [Chitinimonas taiwanensis]SFZ77731.1 Cytochrome b [Chitinimonas taiwanensis DSM 18899]
MHTKPARIAVWDPLVRISHWLVALLVLGNFLNEEGETWHRYAGYTVLGLVLLRLLWGVVGSRYARLSSFWPRPRQVLAYLRALLQDRAPRYLGHNPAAAVMMLALWANLLALVASGWLMGTDAFWGEEWLEDLHELLANGLLVLVGLHVAAAVFESWRERDNLIGAMVHGKKRAPTAHDIAPHD